MTTTVTIKSLPFPPYSSVVAVINEKDQNGVDVVREHALAYGTEHVFNLHGDQRLTVIESRLLMIQAPPQVPANAPVPAAAPRDYRKAIPARNDPAPFLEGRDPA